MVTRGTATLVCDNVSYEFIRGATIDYTSELVRSSFEVRSACCDAQPCFSEPCATLTSAQHYYLTIMLQNGVA